VKQIEKKEQGGQSDLTGYDVDELIAHVMTSAREGRSVDVAYQLT
jgi:hypothetical protein